MTEKFLITIGKVTFVLLASAFFNLLFAFPVMWAWNFAVTATFGLPALTWGKAWCLMWLSSIFIKSILVEAN